MIVSGAAKAPAQAGKDGLVATLAVAACCRARRFWWRGYAPCSIHGIVRSCVGPMGTVVQVFLGHARLVQK
ncbi:hypothetical protein [Anaplasma marginale]|uniref:hypothetical protein n=1 Tax=Anaplasma marginale TaxID=770 RepID=UPI000315C3BA|nr:hypothetical protein [Anaplasma marginale]